MTIEQETQVADQGSENSQIQDINAEIQSRGPEFSLGMDLPRVWATGAQSFVNPETSLLVFREQNLVGDEAGNTRPAVKNVASLVMPTEVLRAVHKMIGDQLGMIDAAAVA
ncbi:hypothetical protein D3Y57_19075 [Sphingomonas paeninsulae]|uniref:Uncharacterized protein n=1 Tax=Sphingomonas paeninsulae TaxID=2319844 RepID=A0A494TEE2_SPHPE|nr:hypothetical protein [Sphingomonas paeninsulae]AYJ87640.1 hypothetical protein D3Y57_19075 [Sphingomonas paeninsulae]